MLREKHNILKAGNKGVDSRVDSILDDPSCKLATLYRKAEVLSRNPIKKSYIEACLLATPDTDEISSLLEIRKELLEVYSEFFFDLTDVDRLSKIEHIESVKDSNEMLLKLWAFGHGLEFIAWRLGVKVEMSPVEGLRDLFSTCVFKAKEAMYSSSTSEQSRESVKWTKLSMDLARILKIWVLDSSEAKRDLEVAIQSIMPEFVGIDSLLEENNKL